MFVRMRPDVREALHLRTHVGTHHNTGYLA
jgi:hypothetical protein